MPQLYKQNEITVDIRALRQQPLITNTEWFSMDVLTGRKIINITLDNVPLDLTNATVMLGFDFVNSGSSMILDSLGNDVNIEYATGGIVSVMLPTQVQFTGVVNLFIYIVYADGRSFDIGHPVVFNQTESWIDTELPEMQDFYTTRMEDILREMRQYAIQIMDELREHGESLLPELTLQQLEEMDQRVGSLESEDNVTHPEFDEFGVGNNNLISNATEPIIINPAGNLVSAPWLSPVLEPNTTYTVICNVEVLQGSLNSARTSLSIGASTVPNSIEVVDIAEGIITRTFTTPVEQSPFQFRIYAGTGANNNQGNTLRLSNISLTKGTRPNAFRPSFEDNLSRLDRIENLQPTTRRTVATFEGKIPNSDVENPHNVHHTQSFVSLATPQQGMQTPGQGNHNNIAMINDNVMTHTNLSENAIPQHRFIFNIIEHLERNYSTAIWQGFTSLEDKVRIARQIVNRIACVWDGFGVTNGVNWARLRVADSLTSWNTGFGAQLHSNSIPQRITLALTPDTHAVAFPASILPDGTCRFLVHTAEGQTTPVGGASLTTAFVQFEVDVDLVLATFEHVNSTQIHKVTQDNGHALMLLNSAADQWQGDVNNIDVSGFFRCQGNVLNTPFAGGGNLFSSAVPNGAVQIYISDVFDTARDMAVRGLSGTGWTTWRRFATHSTFQAILSDIAEPLKDALQEPYTEQSIEQKVERLEGCIVALLEGIQKAKDSLEIPTIEEEQEIETEEGEEE